MKFRLTILLLVSGIIHSFAQVGVESISTQELKKHLEYLSSDELQGRKFGTNVPGLKMAADYLVETAEKTGLKPGFKNYVQQVKITSSKQDLSQSELIIRNSNQKIVLKTDSIITFNSTVPVIKLEKEIIFCGFGWTDSTSGYNDFLGLDIKDKIVMYSTGTPEIFREELKGKNIRFNNAVERLKWNRVMEMGAAGVILLNSPANKNNSNYVRIKSYMQRSSYSVQNNNSDNNDVVVLIPSSVFDNLYDGKGALKTELSKRIERQNVEGFSKKFFANIQITNSITIIPGENIVGVIEGSDPVLKNECLIYMAHYDHLGVDPNGDVYNGADDNGSGSVTLLELAEAFQTLEKKPKRSIVFLWVTCEELGLLGSHYYSDNPLFPLDKTVACINLDMTGRVYKKRDDVWKNSPKLVKKFKELYCLMGNETEELVNLNDKAFNKVGLIPDKSLPSQFLRSSDHYYFYNKGVPIINYATGYHADYHKVTDEISKINFKKMKKVAELCFYVGYDIANK